MVREKREYVAVLPNSEETIVSTTEEDMKRHDWRQLADEALRKLEKTTSPLLRETIKVNFFRLVIENGKIKRIPAGSVDTSIPCRDYTNHEFERTQNELLAELPSQFHSYVSSEAWDRGHSSGFGEVIQHIRQMVDGLKPVIEKYTDDILKSGLSKKK